MSNLLDIYLLQYNNYYNRQLKKYDALGPYKGFMCEGVLNNNPVTGVNFNPNDGIETELVINWDGELPDYVVVADYNTIISRWFVIESNRTRGQQFRLRLYRDTIVDYYEKILDAPMFVEKGYVGTDDPAIYNSENIAFNQIKKSEYLLRDKTKSAWIVGYCARPKSSTGESISYGGIPSVSFAENSLSDWEFYKYVDKDTAFMQKLSFKVGFYTQLDDYQGNLTYEWVDFNETTNQLDYLGRQDTIYSAITASAYDSTSLGMYRASTDLMNKARLQAGYTEGLHSAGNVTRLNGQRIKVGTGDNTTYYNINVTKTTTDKVVEFNNTTNTGKGIESLIKSGINVNGVTIKPAQVIIADKAKYRMKYKVDTIKVTLTEYSFSAGFTTTLNKDRPLLNDAPYCMFAIPYGDEYKFTDSRGTHLINKINSYSLAVGIATALGGVQGASLLYDLQLLPYCPIPLVRDYGPTVNLTDTQLTDNIIYDIQTESNTLIFWAKDSTSSFDITYNFYVDLNPILYKTKEQTTMFRLCSPNYNGLFDFNPYRNNGIRYFNVDITYRPFQPYIHLNPNFGGLYGQDFDDARGLICSGDFGLPIIEDNWIDYQISNKNYNEIFKRNLSNMEVQYDVQREQEKWGIGTGTFQGIISGTASAGMMSGGNPYAAVAGGLVGGTMSLLAGQRDRELNEILRTEALDYTKDMFNYNIDNIKALPNSLSKVSAYTANNKIFPFLEEYGCTKVEEEAFKNKLIYNGMSINRIGTLKEFVSQKPLNIDYGYYKGKLIRLEGIGDDFHMANTISSELNKGVYII